MVTFAKPIPVNNWAAPLSVCEYKVKNTTFIVSHFATDFVKVELIADCSAT